MPFARRGYRILCVELGENLAVVARRNLGTYPRAEVHVGPFGEWRPQEVPFDLVVSATAFHRLDPEVAYPGVGNALRAGGSLALFWNAHVHTEADRGFFAQVQRIYDRDEVGPERAGSERADSGWALRPIRLACRIATYRISW